MKYEYWFASIKKLSDHKKMKLKECGLSAQDMYYMEEKEFNKFVNLTSEDIVSIRKSKCEWELESNYKNMCKGNIHIITFDMPEYPEKLKFIFHPPYALFVKGNLPTQGVPAIAIVGARKCTPYGEKCAIDFASQLSDAGAEIISGLATGIDGMAQRATINQNAKTFGVLGSGVDVCYPRNHIGLYMDILDHNGGIISEQLPGSKPLGYHFPMRNRIISGLADAVLVIEAKEKSGSLITADLAMDQGKEVYALPGPVTSIYSQGCNRLIKQGAGILLTPKELIEDLAISARIYLSKNIENSAEKEIMLESTEKLVYSCVSFDSKNIDWIASETKLPALMVVNALISLELKGFVKETAKNNYVKT